MGDAMKCPYCGKEMQETEHAEGRRHINFTCPVHGELKTRMVKEDGRVSVRDYREEWKR